MSKLYVGHLPSDVNEETLKQLFLDHGVNSTSILVKRGGYAFIDCPDQSIADKAIDKLNGYNFMGSPLVVEPSVGGKKSGEGRIRISNLPEQVSLEDIENLCSAHGTINKCEKLTSRDSKQLVQVTFDAADQAQEAVEKLNNYQFEGANLRVEAVVSRPKQKAQRNAMAGPNMAQQRQSDFPLRILVLSDMVGAIIGRQGNTIRAITQQTRARVDVHRKDNAGSLEKAITIFGNPENVANACKKILEVMQQEAASTNKGDITLKMLAHNNLIGRIIGKNGQTIKKIMSDTDTKITVSPISDINNFNMERTISIRGSLDNMCEAEAVIFSKLKASYEHDLQTMQPQGGMMFPGMNPMSMMGMGGGYRNSNGFLYGGPSPNGGGPGYPPMYPAQSQVAPRPPLPQQQPPQPNYNETTFMYIPNSAVGAIIGTKGSHIRNIIRFSGASVKIAPLDQETPRDANIDRKVTITGEPEGQWKAQFLIYEKMREEGYAVGLDDVRLTTEIRVPTVQVGRIIGKNGANVRELQRNTGAVINVPMDRKKGEENGAIDLPPDTAVHISGPFYSVQAAQRRIRQGTAPTRLMENGPSGPLMYNNRGGGPPMAGPPRNNY